MEIGISDKQLEKLRTKVAKLKLLTENQTKLLHDHEKELANKENIIQAKSSEILVLR